MLPLGADSLFMGGGFIAGLIGNVINKSMEHKHERELKLMDKSFQDVDKARKITNKHFQWTRRIIALMLISAYALLPTIVMWTGHPTYVGYSDSNGWLWGLFKGSASIHWKMLPNGFVLTPGLEAMCFSVVGLYFGKST